MSGALVMGFLARLIGSNVPARQPDFIIGDDQLRRWYRIPRNRLFNVYTHHIQKRDEDRALHDHPWFSISIVLTEGLGEIYSPDTSKPFELKLRWFRKGQIVFRTGKSAHRLIVKAGDKPVTLFITGPRYRKWGFWCPHSWRFYLDFVDGKNPGRKGRGCE